VRSLGQPEVLRSASLAGLLTALVCYPRLALATNLAHPIWYLEALLFLGGIILWAFVFAWHPQYTHRPVVTFRIPPLAFGLATATGLFGALVLHFWLDPTLRTELPEDYPLTFKHWLAATLFSLAFTQLFVVFAPFAWLLRLSRRKAMALLLTVLFGVFVMLVRNRAATIPPWLLAALLVVRVLVGFLSVYFFWRGGVLLVWWWNLLLQSRHLLKLLNEP
jgi:hypothetical protein